jgi:hypothetical protein
LGCNNGTPPYPGRPCASPTFAPCACGQRTL